MAHPAHSGAPAAFPSDYTVESHRYINEGLTFRDYFAAKAMAAYISTYPCPGSEANEPQPEMDSIATDAYAMADAMLAAREAS